MLYKLNGVLKDGKLSGKVVADVDGEEVEEEWRAHRSE